MPVRDLRLLQAAVARREQEEKEQRGITMRAGGRGGSHGSVYLQEKCAVCRSRLRQNQFGDKWCVQTAKHKALS
jgi:RNase adaptor protein for sRNA GlmZ degradation